MGDDTDDKKYEFGKPPLDLDLKPSTTLPDLVGENSFMIFDLLHLSWDWLGDRPETWEDNIDYKKMRDYIRTVKVTNDVAERGVKLVFQQS